MNHTQLYIISHDYTLSLRVTPLHFSFFLSISGTEFFRGWNPICHALIRHMVKAVMPAKVTWGWKKWRWYWGTSTQHFGITPSNQNCVR